MKLSPELRRAASLAGVLGATFGATLALLMA